MAGTRLLGMIGLLLTCLVGQASGGIPCAAYSASILEFQRPTGPGLPCGQCDLVWDPRGAGESENLLIRVTVRDCDGVPVPGSFARLDLSGSFLRHPDITTATVGRICGTPSRSDTTDANGAARLRLRGGGSGRIALHWVVTISWPGDSFVLSDNWDTLCVKSPDFNGSGNVNFLDTFIYVPSLVHGTGYSGDFKACSALNTVNFQDTMFYAPFLFDGSPCQGGPASFVLTTVTSMGESCDQLFN